MPGDKSTESAEKPCRRTTRSTISLEVYATIPQQFPGELGRTLREKAWTSNGKGRKSHHIPEATFAFGVWLQKAVSGQPSSAIVPAYTCQYPALVRQFTSPRAGGVGPGADAYIETAACRRAFTVFARS